MSAKQDQAIIDGLNSHYGIEASKLTLLPIGADRNASIYKAEALDKTAYFVKVKQGHHQDLSIEVLELLQMAGIKQIIPPIKSIDDKTTQRMKGFTLIVYPFIEGQDGFSRNLTDDQWITLGRALRQVHKVEVPPSIQKHIRKESYSPKWRGEVRSLCVHLDTASIYDEIAIKLQKFMKSHLQVICRLVDRAEQLAQIVKEQSPECVLCHSDIHGGNVLIDKNGMIYIVDWDEPIMAPKERDLMFIGGGIGNVWNNPHEESLFYKGYGKTEVNLATLAYYRHERIVEDMAIYGKELLLTMDPSNNREETYRYFIEMFESGREVEIAFKTDEDLTI